MIQDQIALRREYIMPPWLFNVYMDAVKKEVKMEMGRRGDSGDFISILYCSSTYIKITP